MQKGTNFDIVHELYLLGVEMGKDLRFQIQTPEKLDLCDAFLSRCQEQANTCGLEASKAWTDLVQIDWLKTKTTITRDMMKLSVYMHLTPLGYF